MMHTMHVHLSQLDLVDEDAIEVEVQAGQETDEPESSFFDLIGRVSHFSDDVATFLGPGLDVESAAVAAAAEDGAQEGALATREGSAEHYSTVLG